MSSPFATPETDALLEHLNEVGPMKRAPRILALSPPPVEASLSVDFHPRDLAERSVVDVNWLRLTNAARSFLGAGWKLVRLLSNEEAWERIKWIQGEPVERDPWA